MPARVYEYGLLPPTINAELVGEQMRKAHVYRNLLTEIERRRREAVRLVMLGHPDIGPLEAQITELVAQRDAARQIIVTARRATRSRSESAEQRQAVRDLGAQIKVLREQARTVRRDVIQAVKPQLDVIDEAARQEVRDARGRCGVYWGTYLLQEADADRARQEKSPPNFRPWRGEGRISVQLQGGISIEDMLSCADTQLRVEPVPDDAFSLAVRRGVRRRAQRSRIWIRVGSNGRAPIWAAFPMIYHRPLPPGARIKVATITRRRRDCRTWSWLLHLTIDIPETTVLRPVPATGAVAVNLGFCLRAAGDIRVGYAVGTDGVGAAATEEEILTPRTQRGSLLDSLGKASSIQGFRDKWMDRMKALLSQWFSGLQELHDRIVKRVADDAAGLARDGGRDGVWIRLHMYQTLAGPALPPWFYTALTTMHAWRSADRFRALAFRWRAERFPSDTLGFNVLEGGTDGKNGWRDERDSWRYRDEHLERYQTGTRRHALLRRREHYRITAARLAATYKTLVIDDSDLSTFQRSPRPESEAVDKAPIKYQQTVAAASELRLSLVNAFGPARVVKISPSTVACHHCGTINEWDRANAERLHSCTGCGKTWDQDANACRNMLRQYQLELEHPPQEDKPKAKPTRSQRLRGNRQAATSAAE